MMKMSLTFLLCLVAVAASTVVEATDSLELRGLQSNDEIERELQVPVDFFFPEDVCENENGQFGVCDQSRFPTCDSRSRICYNRRPMRDSFYADNRQPFFYIDYSLVFCYPASWSGCSSCSPGRYCTSEARCILDEQDYPCAQWI